MFRSIKTRLLLWLITSFAVIMTALGIFLYNRLDVVVIEMVDHLLADKSEILEGLIHVEKGEVEFEISDITAGDYAIKNSGHYFEITDGKRATLVKSKSLGQFSFSKSRNKGDAGYYTETGPAGEPVRLFIHQFKPAGDEILFVYVAEDIKSELQLLSTFKIFLMLVFPVTVLISTVGSAVIIWVSLKPLSSFSQQVGTITEKRLHERVDATGVDAELRELATSFNETMDRLEKAFQLQRDFLSDASHELRTPTTVIGTVAQLSLRKERSVEEYREALKTIKTMSERMGNLVERLLKVSRLDAGKGGLRKEKLKLKEVFEKALKSVSLLAEERGIGVIMEKVDDMMIEGDPEQLIELFLGIIDNAIKYNRPRGSITVSLSRSGDWAVTRITDTGIGIEKEALDKVFERFYRADASRGEIPGTGLGLPIARGIAEAHGGKIEIESEAGKGSTFTVYLPVLN